MLKQKKLAKPFFLEDSEGNLFKATKIADEDIPLDEDETGKVLEEEIKKDEESSDGEVAVMLSLEDFELLKQIIAERKEVHDADKDEDKKEEEKKEEDKVEDECQGKDEEEMKEEVVDTKAKDSISGFGSIENSKQSVNDSVDAVQDEICAAWLKRYDNVK